MVPRRRPTVVGRRTYGSSSNTAVCSNPRCGDQVRFLDVSTVPNSSLQHCILLLYVVESSLGVPRGAAVAYGLVWHSPSPCFLPQVQQKTLRFTPSRRESSKASSALLLSKRCSNGTGRSWMPVRFYWCSRYCACTHTRITNDLAANLLPLGHNPLHAHQTLRPRA